MGQMIVAYLDRDQLRLLELTAGVDRAVVEGVAVAATSLLAECVPLERIQHLMRTAETFEG